MQDLLAHLTLAEKIGLLSIHQLPIPRLDIGEWYIGTEVARGYVSRDPEEPSTVFPQPIGMASTFDPSLMYQRRRGGTFLPAERPQEPPHAVGAYGRSGA